MTIFKGLNNWTIKSASIAPVVGIVQQVTFKISYMIIKVQIIFCSFYTAKLNRQRCSLVREPWTVSSVGCIRIAVVFIANRLGQFTRNYTQTTKRGLLTTNKG